MADVDAGPVGHPVAVEHGSHNPQHPSDASQHAHREFPESTPSEKESATLPLPKDLNGYDKTSSRASELASQPMSKAPSSSSHNDSSKDEASSGAVVYGTRSRNRPNASRPNYAEDQDVDFELASMKVDVPQRSASHESGSKSRAPSEAARQTQTTLRLTTGPPKTTSGFAAVNTSSPAEKNNSQSPADPQGEKKKRKYERSAPPKPMTSGANPPNNKDALPGMSLFSTSSNGTPEAPPPKRRKTGDDIVITPTTSKKRSSMAGYKPYSRGGAIVTFENTRAIMHHGKLTADDGTAYARDDCVYMICEPPGDPYYLGRIMEFRTAQPGNPKSPVVSLLVNWFYRPKDIGRYSNDPRFLFASMQSDESPLNSLRGKCQIKHRQEIGDLDEFRRQRDSFYFMQLYDRYSHRPYEMIPANAVINVPPNVKKAIDDQWKFLVVEPVRQKELTSAVKLCKRCGLYCAPEKSVDCGVCRDTYHMTCVNPPLSRKPSRGFAWSCGPCSRAQERKLEERHTAVIESENGEEGDKADEEEGENEKSGTNSAPPELMDLDGISGQPPEQTEVAKSNMWPWRYLGVHCRIEDVLQYDDRAIYPRASSRLGNRHQADTKEWFGRPVELRTPLNLVKKFKSLSKGKDPKVSKEIQAQYQQEKAQQKTRPGYIQDEPSGYVARGEDYDADDPRCTATPMFVRRSTTTTTSSDAAMDTSIDEYMDKARKLAREWGLITISKKGDSQISTNYLDQALRLLSEHHFNTSAALQELSEKHSPAILKNPELNEIELKKFEDGVAKYGSDLRSVRKHVKTKPHGAIVRFYYTWKFTQKGTEVWSHSSGRKGVRRRAESSWLEIAHDEDDSAFDNDKAEKRKRRFQCKHCATRSARQWRRAPNVTPGATVLADPKGGKEKANQLILALCERCAVLWRRYALIWSDPEEIARSFVQTGGRQWKKRQEEDWLRELVLANEVAGIPTGGASAAAAASMGIELSVPSDESWKKKVVTSKERDITPTIAPPAEPQKKKPAPPPPPPREPTPPIEPSPPRKRDLPCAVCRNTTVPSNDVKLECGVCRLSVHRNCYGITDAVSPAHWVCDTCVNDKKQQYLLRYECAACPVVDRSIELFEAPKNTHKKKTERDREKERLEKILVASETDTYLKNQRKRGRPQYPREALKLTENSNWMHIVCAVWTPEIKFSNAAQLQRAEGMAAVVNSQRMEQTCKICKKAEKSVVTCHQCHAPFHAMCAHEAGYIFGFDVTPVKGSRKDSISSVTVGAETGSMTAVIWCKEHSPKTIVHDLTEVVAPDTAMTALQLFTKTYKQADLTLTGTARKANLLAQSTKALAGSTVGRRVSTLPNGTSASKAEDHVDGVLTNGVAETSLEDRRCQTCGIDSSIKWHQSTTNGSQLLDVEGDTPQNVWLCHKCFMQSKQSRSPSMDLDKPEEIKPIDEEPDLFRPKRSLWNVGGMENLEHFAEELRQTTIVLTNPKFGGLHVFQGKDFGLELDSDPRPAFRLVVYQASVKCGYDQERDVIITEDGSWVTFPKSMMQALVKMIVAGSREGHWRVVSARDVPCKLMQNIHLPAAGPGQQPTTAPFPSHLRPPSFDPPTAPYAPASVPGPSLNSHYPSMPPLGINSIRNIQALAPPFTPHIPRGPPPPPISNAMPGPGPFPSRGSAAIQPPSVPPPTGYQPATPQSGHFNTTQVSASAPNGPTTPNGISPGPSTQKEPQPGASSSPSLQNLLRPS